MSSLYHVLMAAPRRTDSKKGLPWPSLRQVVGLLLLLQYQILSGC